MKFRPKWLFPERPGRAASGPCRFTQVSLLAGEVLQAFHVEATMLKSKFLERIARSLCGCGGVQGRFCNAAC